MIHGIISRLCPLPMSYYGFLLHISIVNLTHNLPRFSTLMSTLTTFYLLLIVGKNHLIQ